MIKLKPTFFRKFSWVFISLSFLYVLYSYVSNTTILTEFNGILHLNLLLHLVAISLSIRHFNNYRIPFILLVSIFNFFEYAFCILIVPPDQFQLSKFNYSILFDLFWGFSLFYLIFFILILSLRLHWLDHKLKFSLHISSRFFLILKNFFLSFQLSDIFSLSIVFFTVDLNNKLELNKLS